VPLYDVSSRFVREQIKYSPALPVRASVVTVLLHRVSASSNQPASRARLMNDPRKKNPTLGIAVLIVVVVLLVLATILYNAITERREYERENPPESVASAASAAAAAVNAVKGAASSQ
jgi:Na+-transporting methylmalonyl-CoA/oxaloacetate decarboxylase gamma subunit